MVCLWTITERKETKATQGHAIALDIERGTSCLERISNCCFPLVAMTVKIGQMITVRLSVTVYQQPIQTKNKCIGQLWIVSTRITEIRIRTAVAPPRA